MTLASLFVDARAILRMALTLDHPNVILSPEGEFLILGQVWGESRFGAADDWAGSNNWGACVYYKNDGKFFLHGDRTAEGRPVSVRFQAFDSQLEGARGYLHTLLHGDVPAALELGHSEALARALYKNGYFTGVAGTSEDRIEAYAHMLSVGASLAEDSLAVADGLLALDTVMSIQERLVDLDYDPGPIDGVMGPKTILAVEQFQRDHALKVDGVVGILTRRELRKGPTRVDIPSPT